MIQIRMPNILSDKTSGVNKKFTFMIKIWCLTIFGQLFLLSGNHYIAENVIL